MMCSTGKESFKYQADAVEFNKMFGATRGIYFNMYKCPICGYWHLTSRRSNRKHRKLH